MSSTKTAEAKPVHEDPAEASRLCNQWVESGVTKNSSIQFLLKTLIDSGCTPPDKFIRCMQCVQPQAGGFGMVVEEGNDKTTNVPDEQCQRTMKHLQAQFKREQDGDTKLTLQPEIFVCQQYMRNELMTHKTVHHELVHAIDLCRSKMDPIHNCIHLACTEIRAENLSGECSFANEMFRMKQFSNHGKECVQRRAILSVKANPNCADRAQEYVEAALPRCYQDYYPYDRHPNER